MDIWQIVRITIRRWYVFLAVVAVGIATALVTTSGVKPQYSAAMDAFVNAPPSRASAPTGSVENSGGVGFAGSLEERAMDADASRAQIHKMGLLPTYKVSWTRAKLVLSVSVTGPTPDLARRTVEEVVAMANRHLVAHQASTGVTAPGAQYSIMPAAEGANLSPAQYPGRSRQRIVIGVVALAAAVGLAVALDGFVAARRRAAAGGTGRPDSLPDAGSPRSPLTREPDPLGDPLASPRRGGDTPGRDTPEYETAAVNEDTVTIRTGSRLGAGPVPPDLDRSGRPR